LSVLGVASEMYPLVKTGGLADVVGALPAALAPNAVRVRTLMPGYPAVMEAVDGADTIARWPDFLGGSARLLAGATRAGLELIVLDSPQLYARPGNPYVDDQGRDWPDNAVRFAALACAGARIAWGEVSAFVPDVLHVHDWQAALAPAYMHYLGHGRRCARSVLTLHNLAFQGTFRADVWARLGLPETAFTARGLEYHGSVGFLKAGIHYADAITTVSPTYAGEILREAHGMGLDAMLRWRSDDLSGIVNGIDTQVWDPDTDIHLARTYTTRTLERRLQNKRAVESRFGLPPEDSLLLCMISRLTAQKGIDLVAAGLDALVDAGARLVVLGSGDASLEAALRTGAQRHPGRVALHLGYDEALSHLMQGGCDAILVPSRFEPCGLTQLCGLRYGCVPVVSRVGGLADTVIDANDAAVKAGVATGLTFADISLQGLQEAVRRAVRLFGEPRTWARMQTAGMHGDVGWRYSASQYAALYRRLLRPVHEKEASP
jgi:starch synthase